MEALRELIEQYLRTRDESQADLAHKSGVPQNVISRWLNAQVSSASARNLRKLAPVLGLTYEELLRRMGELPAFEDATADPDETELLAIYRQVPTEHHSTVKDMLRGLIHRRNHHVDHAGPSISVPEDLVRPKSAEVLQEPVPSAKRRSESRSLAAQKASWGFQPAFT